jgi:small-conductance mechanosensitive channel
MTEIINYLTSLAFPVAIAVIVFFLLYLNNLIFKKIGSVRTSVKVLKGSISLIIVLVGILIFILSLPIEHSMKGQILSFLGIIVSAGIALSSTTLLGNIMAGFMNNSMNRFKNGDLIDVGEFKGRVTGRSPFHTEIQLEDSNFVTIPNLYIASHPVKLTRKTNTVISSTVSLGYDVPRAKVEEALKKAALDTGLKDPYVYIIALGDYSVVYKIHGFLVDSGKFFSNSSTLNAMVMDSLHESGIEIVSPSFMNQRRVDENKFIPRRSKEKSDESESSPEDLIFDKAIESEKIENKKEYLIKIRDKQNELKKNLKEIKDEDRKINLQEKIEKLEGAEKRLEEDIKKKLEENGE